MPSRLLATALAAICTVPNREIMLTTRMRPAWNRLFSKADGMPMPRMRFASAPSTRSVSRARTVLVFQPQAARIRTAATARLTTVGQATPSTYIPSPKIQTALPTMLMTFISTLTCIEIFELPMLRKMAAPALYKARKG